MRMHQHPTIAMVMNVDETRRDDAATAIDRLLGLGAG